MVIGSIKILWREGQENQKREEVKTFNPKSLWVG